MADPKIKPASSNNYELRINMHGRKDRNGEDYYLARPSIPCTIDLSRAALFFFPATDDDNDSDFKDTLVVKLADTPKRSAVRPGGHDLQLRDDGPAFKPVKKRRSPPSSGGVE